MSTPNVQVPPPLPTRKSPGLAGFLSMMPGLGQAYVGYYAQAFANILIFASGIWLADRAGSLEAFIGPCIGFFYLFNIIDAVRKANLYNRMQLGEREGKVPTDSPLVAGVALLVIGTLAALHFTFGMDMDWLEDLWPFVLIAIGGYFIWRYRRTRSELQSAPPRYTDIAPPRGPFEGGGDSSSTSSSPVI